MHREGALRLRRFFTGQTPNSQNFMIRKFLSSQFRINMVSGSVTAVINAVVMAIAYPVYLYFLGYEKYGVWLVLSVVLTFAQLGNLGIRPAVMKLVAEEHGRGNTKGIQSYVTTSLAILLFSGTIALILILLLRSQIVSAFNLSARKAAIASQFLPYIAFLSVCVALVQVLNSTVSGLGRMDIANYILSGGRVVTVGTSLILLWLGNGIESLLIGNTVSYILVGGASVFVIRKTTNLRLLRLGNLDNRRFRKLLRFGGGVFGGSLVSMFLHPFNKLMLSRYAGITTVPVYEIAFAGSMAIRGLFEVGLRALMPEISRISANMTRYAKDRISQINRRAMKFIFVFGIPLYGGLIIVLTPLLKFWLRQKFVDELPIAFRIMLISTFLSLLGVPAYYTLLGLGMVRHTLIAHIILSSVSTLIVLTIVSIWQNISVVTVSWAILSATVVSTLYLNWQNTRRFLKTG